VQEAVPNNILGLFEIHGARYYIYLQHIRMEGIGTRWESYRIDPGFIWGGIRR